MLPVFVNSNQQRKKIALTINQLACSYMDHATPFHYKLKILKIPELYKDEVGKLVFHYHHQRLTPLLSNLFTKTNQVSQKSTRSSRLPIILP